LTSKQGTLGGDIMKDARILTKKIRAQMRSNYLAKLIKSGYMDLKLSETMFLYDSQMAHQIALLRAALTRKRHGIDENSFQREQFAAVCKAAGINPIFKQGEKQ
jgi:hypothetical protein